MRADRIPAATVLTSAGRIEEQGTRDEKQWLTFGMLHAIAGFKNPPRFFSHLRCLDGPRFAYSVGVHAARLAFAPEGKEVSVRLPLNACRTPGVLMHQRADGLYVVKLGDGKAYAFPRIFPALKNR